MSSFGSVFGFDASDVKLTPRNSISAGIPKTNSTFKVTLCMAFDAFGETLGLFASHAPTCCNNAPIITLTYSNALDRVSCDRSMLEHVGACDATNLLALLLSFYLRCLLDVKQE